MLDFTQCMIVSNVAVGKVEYVASLPHVNRNPGGWESDPNSNLIFAKPAFSVRDVLGCTRYVVYVW